MLGLSGKKSWDLHFRMDNFEQSLYDKRKGSKLFTFWAHEFGIFYFETRENLESHQANGKCMKFTLWLNNFDRSCQLSDYLGRKGRNVILNLDSRILKFFFRFLILKKENNLVGLLGRGKINLNGIIGQKCFMYSNFCYLYTAHQYLVERIIARFDGIGAIFLLCFIKN
jgi:hypothetical protein